MLLTALLTSVSITLAVDQDYRANDGAYYFSTDYPADSPANAIDGSAWGDFKIWADNGEEHAEKLTVYVPRVTLGGGNTLTINTSGWSSDVADRNFKLLNIDTLAVTDNGSAGLSVGSNNTVEIINVQGTLSHVSNAGTLSLGGGDNAISLSESITNTGTLTLTGAFNINTAADPSFAVYSHGFAGGLQQGNTYMLATNPSSVDASNAELTINGSSVEVSSEGVFTYTGESVGSADYSTYYLRRDSVSLSDIKSQAEAGGYTDPMRVAISHEYGATLAFSASEGTDSQSATFSVEGADVTFVEGGTTQMNGATGTITASADTSINTSFDLNASGSSLVFAKDNSTSGDVSITVGGSLSSSSVDAFNRNVTIEQGVQVIATALENNWGMGAVTVDGTLKLSGNLKFSCKNSNGNNRLTGQGSVEAGSLVIANSGTYDFDVRSLVINGAATMNGDGWGYAPTLNINDGELVLSQGMTITDGILNINAGATLTLANGSAITNNSTRNNHSALNFHSGSTVNLSGFAATGETSIARTEDDGFGFIADTYSGFFTGNAATIDNGVTWQINGNTVEGTYADGTLTAIREGASSTIYYVNGDTGKATADAAGATSIVVNENGVFTITDTNDTTTQALISGTGKVNITCGNWQTISMGANFSGTTHVTSGNFRLTGSAIGNKLEMDNQVNAEISNSTTVTADVQLNGDSQFHQNGTNDLTFEGKVTGSETSVYQRRGAGTLTFNNEVSLHEFQDTSNTTAIAWTTRFEGTTTIDTVVLGKSSQDKVGTTYFNGITGLENLTVKDGATAYFNHSSTQVTNMVLGTGTVYISEETGSLELTSLTVNADNATVNGSLTLGSGSSLILDMALNQTGSLSFTGLTELRGNLLNNLAGGADITLVTGLADVVLSDGSSLTYIEANRLFNLAENSTASLDGYYAAYSNNVFYLTKNVPEPATATLSLLALAALAARRRRK